MVCLVDKKIVRNMIFELDFGDTGERLGCSAVYFLPLEGLQCRGFFPFFFNVLCGFCRMVYI